MKLKTTVQRITLFVLSVTYSGCDHHKHKYNTTILKETIEAITHTPKKLAHEKQNNKYQFNN
jgi:hypothetical protein